MNNSVKIISEHARNGVVPLSILKKANYPIYRYLLSNYKLILRQLKNHGISVLNDMRTLNNIKKIKLYLLYYYGEDVDVTVLRKKDRTVYNYLSKRGKPWDVITSLGFSVKYHRYGTEEFIRGELYRIADSKGVIFKISDSQLYSKLYYRAKKSNISITEYIATHGFSYKEVDVKTIIKLREDGKSFSEISSLMSIPRSTIHRVYLQEVFGKQ